MSASQSGVFNLQQFTDLGAPLVGGRLYTYAYGTTTQKTAYTDHAGLVPHTYTSDGLGGQYIALNSRGELPAPLYLSGGSYDLALKTAAGATVWTRRADPVWDIANDLSTSTGSSLIGWIQSGVGAVVRWVQDKLRDARVTPKDFGAVGDGVTNDTAAVQAAINTKRCHLTSGTYLVDTLYIPNSATTGEFSFTGDIGAVLQARTANTVVLQKIATPGVVEGATIGPFSIKAHSSGSTTGAIKVTGFRGSTFDRIVGLSNGTKGFASLFDVAASPYLCYDNLFIRPNLNGVAGWTYMFNFNNNGAGVGSNSNTSLIIDPWCVDTTGMSVVINAKNSAKLSIKGGLIENNAGATAIKPGNTTTVQDVWFELNNLDFVYDPDTNDGLVMGCYFSTAHNVDFGGTSVGNLWLNNTEAGAQTFVNSPGVSNVKIKLKEEYTQPAPTMVYSAGVTGTLTFASATVMTPFNQITRQATYNIRYIWTASTTGYTSFTFNLPSGYSLVSYSAGMTRQANGIPRTVGMGGAGGPNLSVDNGFTDGQEIDVFITIYKA